MKWPVFFEFITLTLKPCVLQCVHCTVNFLKIHLFRQVLSGRSVFPVHFCWNTVCDLSLSEKYALC